MSAAGIGLGEGDALPAVAATLDDLNADVS